MNIDESKVLLKIMDNKEETQRELSKTLSFSLGKINNCLKSLQEQGVLNGNDLTKKGNNLISESKVKCAVILAAGFGFRMVPINNELPKALLTVRGEVLIERLIEQLHEKGINNIYVVVGFMKEKFEYLIDEYKVKLVVNSEYKNGNNCISLNAASKYIIDNTYIIPGDLYFVNNPFSLNEFVSYYMLSNDNASDGYGVSKKGYLLEGKKASILYRPIGVCFIGKEDINKLKNNLLYIINKSRDYYWEEVLFCGDMKMYANIREDLEYFEINSYEDLKLVDGSSKDLRNKNMKIIIDTLNCSFNDIENVTVLKAGMTNRSFLFNVKDKKYIMRIPGEGTELLINRKQEASVYKIVSKLGISDNVIYMDENNGVKITEFYSDARCCDINKEDDVRRCMEKLRKFHNLRLFVNHEFNLKENILKYETLMGSKSLYSDYDRVKERVFKLIKIIEKLDKEYVLCHIDSVCDNFLITSDEKIKLIDWEYAGMNDPHVDIAMFVLYAGYCKEDIDKLINYYFEHDCDINVRYKIYAYIAICGLLWSNWCEFKYSLGVEFGEYSLNQYRYAKEYSNIALSYFLGGEKDE